MKAKDIMISLEEYLRPDNTLKEAVNIFKTAKRDDARVGVRGLPVIDEKGKMVGFLTIRDILKAVFPSYMSLMDLGDFTWDGMVEDMAKKIGSKKVSELMTKKVISVNEEAPLMECVDHLLRNNIRRLPVIAKDSRVVGMLYEMDIFVAITKAMLE
ncbi:MAG: CBS domain-containing protein [Nitrospirae bacterium]|nr:CBS domain-containing protein [Nitrospirota bacterium]